MPPALAQWPRFDSQWPYDTCVFSFKSDLLVVCVCVCVLDREREESSICVSRKCARYVAGNQVVSSEPAAAGVWDKIWAAESTVKTLLCPTVWDTISAVLGEL